MTANIRLYAVLAFVIPITMALAPVQYLALLVRHPLSRKLPVWWHRMVVRLLGIRVRVKGKLPAHRPLLIASNHVSWADIPVLASLMELCFIAKHDVDDMPGANLLARLQRTVYVVREDRRNVDRQVREIADRLLSGDVLVLFPEGTTGDGNRIGPFKSSLFAAAQHVLKDGAVDHILVQPVSLAYTGLHGLPLGRYQRSLAAWPGAIGFGAHVRKMIYLSAWDVEVSFGEPIRYESNMRRHELSRNIRSRIREMFQESLYGDPA